jgi:hypothetical protein
MPFMAGSSCKGKKGRFLKTAAGRQPATAKRNSAKGATDLNQAVLEKEDARGEPGFAILKVFEMVWDADGNGLANSMAYLYAGPTSFPFPWLGDDIPRRHFRQSKDNPGIGHYGIGPMLLRRLLQQGEILFRHFDVYLDGALHSLSKFKRSVCFYKDTNSTIRTARH